MSFSFTVKGPTKHKVKVRAREAFADVCRSQPVHETDREAVMQIVDMYVDMLSDDPTHDISLNVHGSLMWIEEHKFTTASVGVSAWHVPKVRLDA